MAVGILLMVLSGGCSLYVLTFGDWDFLIYAIVFGGPPFLCGFLIYRAAKNRTRRGTSSQGQIPTQDPAMPAKDEPGDQ